MCIIYLTVDHRIGIQDGARENPPKMVHSLGSNRTESFHIFNNFHHFLSHQWHMGRDLYFSLLSHQIDIAFTAMIIVTIA
jgi:hypothetical protein